MSGLILDSADCLNHFSLKTLKRSHDQYRHHRQMEAGPERRQEVRSYAADSKFSVQRLAKVDAPSCVNAADKFGQK